MKPATFNVKACHSGNGGSSGSRIAVSHGYGLRENNGTKHDFDNDPIETIVDGEWLRANGTTLGADNGIGVAAELALLASDDIQHGPIECLFTVDEETGLTGAKALKEGFMTGDILLNLDSEDEERSLWVAPEVKTHKRLSIMSQFLRPIRCSISVSM